jgi:hypothetical protein
MKRTMSLVVLIIFVLPLLLTGQQVADTSYCPLIEKPSYARDSGPVVFIDEGHFNFHTKDGRYLPFAMLLERDGYQVKSYTGMFEAERLKRGHILVIANALNEVNTTNWYKPVLPAFTAREIDVVKQWVEQGGSLFLIADHMPMGGAAAGLAAAFGFTFTDGFAMNPVSPGPAFFSRNDQTLSDNIITNGRNRAERIDTIATFTGQAFPIPPDASSIIQFDKRFILMLSDTAWVFDSTTQYKNIEGWSQAAYKTFGRGRVVVAGEAAMFTAQLAGPQKIPAGMNSPVARRNYQLLLNIIHWLDGMMN